MELSFARDASFLWTCSILSHLVSLLPNCLTHCPSQVSPPKSVADWEAMYDLKSLDFIPAFVFTW